MQFLHSFSILKKKLYQTYKFLTFQEDDPKHHVVGSPEKVEFLIISIASIVLGITVFVMLAYVYFGFLGAVAAYVSSTILTIEIPHIIMDR